MVTPRLLGYDNENGVTLVNNFRKKEEKIIAGT